MRKHLDTVPLATVPNAKAGHVPEGWNAVMVPHHMLRLVSKHEPLMMKKSGENIALNMVDNPVFQSRVSTHAGKHSDMVVRKKFGEGELRRTLN